MDKDYKEINITFTILSEDKKLFNKCDIFKNSIENCEIQYIKKGEYKKYNNGKKSKLPIKNSTLYIKKISSDYNNDIINIIIIYEQLKDYFMQIEYDAYFSIDIYYDKEYPLSLEFGKDVLELLSKNNLSLPISCYKKK